MLIAQCSRIRTVVRILRTKKIGNDVQKFTPGSPKDAHDFDPVRKKIVKDAQNFRPKSPRH